MKGALIKAAARLAWLRNLRFDAAARGAAATRRLPLSPSLRAGRPGDVRVPRLRRLRRRCAAVLFSERLHGGRKTPTHSPDAACAGVCSDWRGLRPHFVRLEAGPGQVLF